MNDLLKPDFERIPQPLRDVAQWVCWRGVWQEKKEKHTKIPIDPKSPTLKFASVDDPSTWSSFEKAKLTYERYRSELDGIGFVLTASDNFVGIDLDHCIEDEKITAEAQVIIDTFDSYTELSPSGQGIRIFALGKLGGSGKKVGKVEIYDRVRYLTLTGHVIGPEPRPIVECQVEIDRLYEEISPTREKGTNVVPFVPSAGDFDMRNYAHQLEGYHEGGGFGRARCPAHNGEGTTSFHVNLVTGAYGCFSGCTTEAIRAAIGHPKFQPDTVSLKPVTITNARDWGPEERKRHLDRFRSATAAQNAMNDLLYRAFTLADYSNTAARVTTAIFACVGQCEEGEVVYRSRLSIARHLKLKGSDENKKHHVSRLLTGLKKEFGRSGRKPLDIVPGNPKQSPGFVIYTFKLLEIADAMRRNHPDWQVSRQARHEATDAAARWFLEQWPVAEPIPETENCPLGPREYGERLLEDLERFLDSRFEHLEEITFEDEVQFYEDKAKQLVEARIQSRRKTHPARTAILEDEPMVPKTVNSSLSVEEEMTISSPKSTPNGAQNGQFYGYKNVHITALKSNGHNTDFRNSVNESISRAELSELGWESTDEANE